MNSFNSMLDGGGCTPAENIAIFTPFLAWDRGLNNANNNNNSSNNEKRAHNFAKINEAVKYQRLWARTRLVHIWFTRFFFFSHTYAVCVCTRRLHRCKSFQRRIRQAWTTHCSAHPTQTTHKKRRLFGPVLGQNCNTHAAYSAASVCVCVSVRVHVLMP